MALYSYAGGAHMTRTTTYVPKVTKLDNMNPLVGGCSTDTILPPVQAPFEVKQKGHGG